MYTLVFICSFFAFTTPKSQRSMESQNGVEGWGHLAGRRDLMTSFDVIIPLGTIALAFSRNGLCL